MDRLQSIDPKLPLKVIPVKIKKYEITKSKIDNSNPLERLRQKESLVTQEVGDKTFVNELRKRYSLDEIKQHLILPDSYGKVLVK